MSKSTVKYSPAKDVLGREIKPGDYIVYGAAKGRCAGLNVGRVLATEAKNDGYTAKPYLKVKAASLQVEWGEVRQAGMNGWGSKPKPKAVHLCFAERMCVVPAETVPDAYKELLDYGD